MYRGYILLERPRNTAADEICTLRSAISKSWPPSTRPHLSTCIDIKKGYYNFEEQVIDYIIKSVSILCLCVQERKVVGKQKREGEGDVSNGNLQIFFKSNQFNCFLNLQFPTKDPNRNNQRMCRRCKSINRCQFTVICFLQNVLYGLYETILLLSAKKAGVDDRLKAKFGLYPIKYRINFIHLTF